MEKHKVGTECVFCLALKQEDGPDNLIVHRGQNVFVILNRYPYTSAHLMVVPVAHEPAMDNLSHETRLEMIETVNDGVKVIQRIYHAHGFNIGMNIGDIAGAGIVGHVHMHVVPRWNGDTNFMTTTGQTRVLPESLEDTYHKLHQSWTELNSKK